VTDCRRRLSLPLIALAVSLIAPIVLASGEKPNEVVYIASSANKRILKIDFDAGTTTVVNTDSNKLKKPVALAVRDDGAGVVHLLVADQFAGKPAQVRHRMVYEALGAMMKHDIHALAIRAYAPGEI